MRTSVRPCRILLALLLLAVALDSRAADASPARSNRRIQVAVVAERADQGLLLPLPTPDRPAYFVAWDGGCIQEGDPSTTEPSSPAAPIARALRESLASQHYLPAAAHAVPSLLVIYHWGLVNRNAHQVASLADVDPNLKARLALVATAEQAGEIENFLMNRLQGRTNAAYRIPENLSVQARRILDLTRHARWFMAVSAYDYDALTRHQPKLVWRVKMSTDQRADLTMAEALPVLLRAGGPFFGRHAEVPQILAAPLLSADEGAAAASISEETSLSPEAAKQVDRADLRNLIRQERAAFSWLRAAQGQTKSLEAESK